MARLGLGLGVSARRAARGPTDAQLIAREAVSPTRINTWHVLGSSRSNGMNGFLTQNCASIPWSGLDVLGTPASTTGHRSTAVTKAGGTTATTSTEIGGTQNWFPQHCIEAVSLGVAQYANVVHGNRIAAGGLTPASYPYLVSRLSSGAVTARGTWYRHAGGVDCSGDPAAYLGPRMYIHGSNFNAWVSPGGAAAAYVTDTVTGSGYGYSEATVPAGRDWTIGAGCVASWATDPNPRQGFPTGQILAMDSVVFHVDLPGVVLVNHSVGGASLDRWTRTNIIADAVFTDLLPLKGPNPLFFIEAVSQSPESGGYANYAAIAAQLDAIAVRCRTAGTDVPLIIYTGYPSYLTGGVNPEWHQWVEEWCRTTPYPVLFLPTHDVRSYDECVALGFFSATETPGDDGDRVHAGPLGNRTFATDIENLIIAAAV